MKVLKFNEEILSTLDIFSHKILEKTSDKYLKYINPYFLLISQCVFSIASAGYLWRFSGNSSDWMQALAQAIMVPAITAAHLCIVLQMKNIKRLHDQLQDIVNDGKFS